jgi:hypothetical protein
MSRTANETLPLTVENTGFLLDRLGVDCHPLQFLRELTQNSIEAILKTPDETGEIVWDVDWTPYELGDHQALKLCVTDNGCGMSGEEMVRHINALSSSGVVQSVDGNYGVGAKIAAATRNHAGLIYLSWQNGWGTMIHLWRDPRNQQYGLRQIERPDDSFGHYADVDDTIKPNLIDQHGTRIVLYGMTDDSDTMKAPAGAPSPSRWVSKYLNSRYFRFPDGIVVRAREGWEYPRSNKDSNILRQLTGQQKYLAGHQQSAGKIELTDAVAHWWILKSETALDSNSGYIESSGHVAALYKDELYEMATGRSGHAKLQQFGVIFGQKQVVIYLEPRTNGNRRITTNTARTQLIVNGESLPWTDWAGEFRQNMPDEIHSHMDGIAAKISSNDHSKSIKDRLKALMDLYKVSRYKPSPNGTLRISDALPTAGGQGLNGSAASTGGGTGTGKRSQKTGPVGGVYSAFLKKDGDPGVKVKPDLFPKVDWVSVTDGSREQGDIEDKAARYLADQHRLLINADFRVFKDMIQHWANRYAHEHSESAGLRDVIQDSVHDWYEQALVETVIGVQALKGSAEWSVKQIEEALSEEALTSVVMQRYHPYNSVKRELGTKIAPLRK